MSVYGFGIRLDGIKFEQFHLGVNLKTGIVAADVGKAVTLDTTADNTFKLAGDGERIYGRLEVVEARTVENQLVGTVEFRFGDMIPICPTEATGAADVVVGSTAVGSGTNPGKVKARVVSAAAAPDPSQNVVTQVLTINSVKYAVVLKV